MSKFRWLFHVSPLFSLSFGIFSLWRRVSVCALTVRLPDRSTVEQHSCSTIVCRSRCESCRHKLEPERTRAHRKPRVECEAVRPKGELRPDSVDRKQFGILFSAIACMLLLLSHGPYSKMNANVCTHSQLNRSRVKWLNRVISHRTLVSFFRSESEILLCPVPCLPLAIVSNVNKTARHRH